MNGQMDRQILGGSTKQRNIISYMRKTLLPEAASRSSILVCVASHFKEMPPLHRS